MSTDGQGTKWSRNITENFNRLSKAYEYYRQTDDRQTNNNILRINLYTHWKLGNGTQEGSSQAIAVNPPSKSKYNWATFSSRILRISLPNDIEQHP